MANGAFDEMIFDFSKAEMGQVLNLADAVTSFDSKEFTKKINDKDKMDKRVRSIRKRLKNALSEEDAKKYTDEIERSKQDIERLELESLQKKNEKIELESKLQVLNSDLTRCAKRYATTPRKTCVGS